MMFTDFHSNGSVSSPTRCGLLTGRYQQRAGLERVLLVPRNDKDKEVGLPSEEITFAKVLGDNGYRTALIGKMAFRIFTETSSDEFRLSEVCRF